MSRHNRDRRRARLDRPTTSAPRGPHQPDGRAPAAATPAEIAEIARRICGTASVDTLVTAKLNSAEVSRLVTAARETFKRKGRFPSDSDMGQVVIDLCQSGHLANKEMFAILRPSDADPETDSPPLCPRCGGPSQVRGRQPDGWLLWDCQDPDCVLDDDDCDARSRPQNTTP